MVKNPADEIYMRRAIELAGQAAKLGEVPVGAVLVERTGESAPQGRVLAETFNRRELDQDPLAHAELLALKIGSEKKKAWRLSGTTLYVTLEPCLMCAGAIVNARVDRVVFGAFDPKGGAVRSLYHALEDSRLNHRCEVLGGVLESECGQLLSDFFRGLRQR